ncbi:MAG: FMN-binding negative transcriptional regulator [Chitinophagaceae bacterium]|nr:FMN-binding negative transcriptional regulator [Chitinophagaceae bacterium]
MYSLPYFTEEDKEEVLRFMHAHPFVTLCGSDAAGRPFATQVPLLFKEQDGRMILEGHIMRNTDHHKAFQQNPQVLAIFTSAHTYVSASWYSNPNQASTWNYQSVHARGNLSFIEEEELRRVLKETTEKYENHRESPASFHNLQPEYINRLIKAIVGFRIPVDEIGNVFKLSQNRDEESFDNIMQKLNAQDEDGRKIASEMNRIKEKLFNKK